MCCMAVGLSSCHEDESLESYSVPDAVSVDMSVDEMKYQFASGLAKMLRDSPEAREVIKAEALKKIDYDYDVLYVMIRSHVLPSGYTFGELLSEYVGENILSFIERELPTLTIFVPELPEDCFSAEIWDTETVAPEVAVLQSGVDGAVILDAEGNDMILTFDQIPAFPVVVVKLNERITANNYLHTKGVELNELAAYGLAFESECFDNLKKVRGNVVTKNQEQIISTLSAADRGGTIIGDRGGTVIIDPRFDILKEAYKQYPAGSGGWQRDYIYYDISPTSPNGVFNLSYKECIWGFEMLGNVESALDKISDQSDDPSYRGAFSGTLNMGDRPRYDWTDGEFEFAVKRYIGSKSGIVNEAITYFRIPAHELFAIVETSTGGTYREHRTRYFKLQNHRVLFATPIPLFSWNLQDYSSTMKLSVEEVDAKESEKQSASTTVEFATNFGFNATFGETEKIGAQFGSSSRESKTISYEITTTKGNDELGDVIVNFGDIILKDTVTVMGKSASTSIIDISGSGSRYTDSDDRRSTGAYLGLSTQYYTGWYRIYIAPALIE